MSHLPCHHDCSDFSDDADTDLGCCSPLPIRITCEAPVLPVQECPNEEAEMTFNAETEEFTLVGQLMDENCQPILDNNSASILTEV